MSPPANAVIGRTAFLFSSILVLALLVACERGHAVTFANQTNQEVVVFEEAQETVRLAPMEKATFDLFEFRGGRKFWARDETGNVLFSEELTWEELDERGWKIVITERSDR